jgi:UDP:flavonoid glycosyltransferase YjiC (YdhE family)
MNHDQPVTFVAGGTRGDVQPYVVLARAMHEHGVPAQVAASLRWRTLVESMGVAYRPLPTDPVELLLQPRFRSALTLSYGVGAGIRSTWQYLRAMRPFVAKFVDEIPRLSDESRAIVAGIASQWIAHPTIGVSMPFIWGLFQPVAPTRDFASPFVQLQLPHKLNRLSHVLMNHMMQVVVSPISRTNQHFLHVVINWCHLGRISPHDTQLLVG